MAAVLHDKWGYEVKTDSEACISAINSYYFQVLCYGRKRGVILEAPKADPHCVLGNILAAHFLCFSDRSRASPFLDAAKSNLENATAYEKKVFDAVSYLISSDRDDDVAVDLHSKLLNDFPRDLVSLKRVQVLCFYMGRPDLSLQRVKQVLPYNEQEKYIYGMLAFALLELGRIEDAEKAAKAGWEICKDDVWSQHALCHAYQYQCHFKEAVAFMEECSRSWNSLSSFMYTHNWWHVALCYLEGQSSITKVEEIYDRCIWKELDRSDATPAEVYLNAAGLVLRVYVRGEIKRFEDRLKILADCLANHDVWFLEWHLDLLIVWALTYTGYISKAEDLVKGLESKLRILQLYFIIKTVNQTISHFHFCLYLCFCRVSQMSKKKQQLMQRGVLLAKALYEYAKGEYQQALESLGLEFDALNYKMIGASDEQLDIFNEIWYNLLINTGHTTIAIQAIEKQLNKREATPFLWRLLEKCYIMEGRPEAAKIGEKARTLEIAYF